METGEMEDGFWFEEAGVPYGQKSNVLLEKSFAFSVRIVNLYKWLHKQHKDMLPVARQILKSGTAIGANAEEANGAYSRKEFAAKLQISLKEAREISYWLRLLFATDYLDEVMFKSLKSDIDELTRLLTAILKAAKQA